MSSYSDIEVRNSKLIDLSKMVVDGHITHKLDFIGTIQINGLFYFNVFRRYNSPYNIVIEDNSGDVYLHQDYTVRKSLQQILCLNESEIKNMYTMSAFSYKHVGPVPSLSDDLADMRWTDIHTRYHAVSINFGGLLYFTAPGDFQCCNNTVEVKQESPSTPPNQIVNQLIEPPPLERKPMSDEDVARVLLSLQIPHIENPFELRECDSKEMSMRVSDVAGRKRRRESICYCEMDEDNDTESVSDSEIDENNYIVLRNGTMIRKLIY